MTKITEEKIKQLNGSGVLREKLSYGGLLSLGRTILKTGELIWQWDNIDDCCLPIGVYPIMTIEAARELAEALDQAFYSKMPVHSIVRERKAISVATMTGTNENFPAFVATCDDGTMWARAIKNGAKWAKLPPIPQPGDQDDK